MSDADEQQQPAADPKAWATACEEDLAAERARRRERYGPPPGDAAEELRRLADAVTERLGRFATQLGVPGGGPLASQARAALGPVLERNADAVRHLANAGQELLAAYRAAALGQEQRWTRTPGAGPERDRQATARETPGDEDDRPATGRAHRVDLD
jgi:hypothetical protein